ncbi:hypothetical protein CVT26_004868 [Gymnopilus dilepis]|uniref:ABC transporter domain-containing protein n=1 Tax=Gymnopilus dilepis TaxID=231916 RepID=A0A409WZ94_9AGAR|nr:hypothetical protein CVT26_004868 [Gymnopilus dilepis]
MWRIDPVHSLEYYFYTFWLACSPALSLWLASCVILKVDQAFKDAKDQDNTFGDLQFMVAAWLFCGLMTHRVQTVMIELRAKLGGSLRAHFLPKLVEAHLQRDPSELQALQDVFPYPSDFGDFIPGWDFFTETFDRLRHITAVMASAFVLIYITSLLGRFEAYVLNGLLLLFFINAVFLPISAAGNGGYTFWTTNARYNRLLALFNIAFDEKYRFSLVKDGLVDYIAQEYRDVSEALGVVEADTWSVGWGLPPSWHWGVMQSWLIKEPMAVCALFIPWATSHAFFEGMVIFNLAIFRMRDSVDILKHAHARSSILDIWRKAEALYRVIGQVHRTSAGLLSFDVHNGVEFNFSSVSYTYPDSPIPAVEDANVTVKPGQVVVISGFPGSGKTTFVKLLCGLLEPTEGQILINGRNVAEYKPSDLRQRVAFVTQSDVIYPLSLKENILLGLSDSSDYNDNDLEQAAHLAGCSDFFHDHKEVVMEPCSIPSYSFQQTPGRAAIEALNRETGNELRRPLLPTEAQFIYAQARQKSTKIVILDDPFGDLDPTAERAVLDNFQSIAKQNEQTVFIVTNQLEKASKADLILYMNKGKLEERKVHDKVVGSPSDE